MTKPFTKTFCTSRWHSTLTFPKANQVPIISHVEATLWFTPLPVRPTMSPPATVPSYSLLYAFSAC